MISLNTRLAVDPHIRYRRFEDEGVVVNQTRAEALVLNDVGTRLLELTDGSTTLEDCARRLCEEFEADPAEVEADVLRFASELLEAGVAHAVELEP